MPSFRVRHYKPLPRRLDTMPCQVSLLHEGLLSLVDDAAGAEV
jgi:hypothetical protein